MLKLKSKNHVVTNQIKHVKNFILNKITKLYVYFLKNFHL